jgi:hypothetical protein
MKLHMYGVRLPVGDNIFREERSERSLSLVFIAPGFSSGEVSDKEVGR